MEPTKGYVYILINPSYEGLVKIGKTTRDPEERVKELSAATGVATPFILVYKRLFQNCHTAEKNIHTVLSDKGYRLTESREFFKIDTTDAINYLLALPDVNDGSQEMSTPEDDMALCYFERAEKLYNGSGSIFTNIDKALEYYSKAAKLGYAPAYECMGHIYREEFVERWGDDKVQREALKCFQKAVDGGCWWCYEDLADTYDDSYNSELARKKYFEAALQHWEEIVSPEEFEVKIGKIASYYIIYHLSSASPVEIQFYKVCASRLKKYAYEQEMHLTPKGSYSYDACQKFLSYLDSISE